MIADRISLKQIYDTLLNIEKSEGKISAIRVKRRNLFGTTKSIPRFDNIEELKRFMNELHPYKVLKSGCDCHTKNEGIYTLTSFQLEKNDRQNNVYNYEIEFKSSVKDLINKTGLRQLNQLNKIEKELKVLLDGYVCFQYIEFGYTQCDYIEIQTNSKYDKLVELYKKVNTKKNIIRREQRFR
ncbi:MAG: hypothetical protein CMP57_03750 [Flavobacteriales bacterium]|nr:hypothetical protein [Flavobacteriales bacterium]|tara:strand:- start:3707 stop:4255 length:549 start_codon:yes stop_codon:yes gene_type:complete